MKNLLLLLVIIVAMVACESPSAKSHRMGTTPTITTERVVIIDSDNERPIYHHGNFYYTYKVNRISKGVVGYATVPGLYEPNDTILVKLVNFRQ